MDIQRSKELQTTMSWPFYSDAKNVSFCLFFFVTLSISTRFLRNYCRRLLDGHAGSAIKVLVAIHYSVLDARNGYIRNVVV